MKICENCKYGIYDSTTGTWDCGKADELTEDQFEKHFVEGEPDCPKWETDYNPAEEEYIAKLMKSAERTIAS